MLPAGKPSIKRVATADYEDESDVIPDRCGGTGVWPEMVM